MSCPPFWINQSINHIFAIHIVIYNVNYYMVINIVGKAYLLPLGLSSEVNTTRFKESTGPNLTNFWV